MSVAMVAVLVMVMVAVVMLMFGKCSLICMCVGIVVHRHFHIETMRLGDVVQRFPVICAPRECKRLTGAVFTPGLNGHSLHRLWSRRREPETRRLPAKRWRRQDSKWKRFSRVSSRTG